MHGAINCNLFCVWRLLSGSAALCTSASSFIVTGKGWLADRNGNTSSFILTLCRFCSPVSTFTVTMPPSVFTLSSSTKPSGKGFLSLLMEDNLLRLNKKVYWNNTIEKLGGLLSRYDLQQPIGPTILKIFGELSTTSYIYFIVHYVLLRLA